MSTYKDERGDTVSTVETQKVVGLRPCRHGRDCLGDQC